MNFDELGIDLDRAVNEKDFQTVSQILTKMWLTAQIHLTKVISPDLKELNYIKTPVETGDGKYLLMFVHVDGNKIQLGDKNE